MFLSRATGIQAGIDSSHELAKLLLRGQNTFAGMAVSPESALRATAVYACVRVLAESVAQLPLPIYRRLERGKQRDNAHSLYALLHDRPNRWQTSFEFREMLTGHVALRGNGYAHKVRARGVVRELIPLNPAAMTVEQNDDTTLTYTYTQRDGAPRVFAQKDIFHLRGLSSDGIAGMSCIALHREAIGLALAAEKLGGQLFGNGAKPNAAFKHPKTLKDASFDNLKKSLEEGFNGDNALRTIILEDGLDYVKIGIDPKDAQFIECVVPGTLFSMADGTRRCAEELSAGDEVLSWDNGPVRARVAAVGRPPVKPLVRIKTARGRQLTATFDHPCLIKSRLRTPGGRPDTAPDQWVVMGCLAPGNYVRVGLGSVEASGDFDADKAWYLGAMVGNGYIRKLGCSFSSADEGVISEMRRISLSMGGDLRPVASSSCGYAINTGGSGRAGSEIRTLLNESGLVGLHSDTKRVPEMVMEGGSQAWAGFLSGYLDTDGHVGELTATQQPKVYWSSVSRELLDDCQHLLALLGINSAIYPMDKGGPREVMGRESVALPGWGLYVTGVEPLRNLAETLSPKHTVKRDRLAAHANLPASRYRAENWLYDCITEVQHLGPGETVGVEIEGVHTHITGGLVTHNTRKFQVEEIARVFRVPLHKIGYLDRATFNNIEQMGLEFVTDTLMPWLVRWEQTIQRDLIEETGSDDIFAEFLVDGLMRGDSVSRSAFYASAITNGWMSRNEVREKENMNSADGLDEFLTPLNMQQGTLNETEKNTQP